MAALKCSCSLSVSVSDRQGELGPHVVIAERQNGHATSDYELVEVAHSGTGETYGKGSLCLFCRSTDGLSPTWIKQAVPPCLSHSITAYVCISLSLHNTHTHT